MERTIQRHFGEAAIPVTACTRGDAIVGVPKGDARIERGMGIGRAHHDAVEALGQRQGTKGLLAVQIIAQ